LARHYLPKTQPGTRYPWTTTMFISDAEGPVRSPTFQFADFRLDCSRFELLRNGRALRVERKPMELLILLASREGELVTRAEIAQRLWSSEVFVDTEHGINTAIRKLRHLLRDDSEDPRFIQTVIGIGYRFIAPIAIETVVPEAVASDTPATIASDPAKARSATDPVPAAGSHRLWVGIAVGAPVLMRMQFTNGHPGWYLCRKNRLSTPFTPIRASVPSFSALVSRIYRGNPSHS
jgi:DNA-binding winged helix-turn-helix (wHTH) protein